MRQIRKLIFHCSDSDNRKHDNLVIIRGWHIGRGFSDIGYHFLILQNGTVLAGRPVSNQGAHCKGQNEDSIGICLTGRDKFTEAQFEAAQKLAMDLCWQFGLGNDQIFAHNIYYVK